MSASDTQRARSSLRKTLRGLDDIERSVRGCSDSQLCSTLRDIQRRKAAHSAGLIEWLQSSDEDFTATASETVPRQGAEAERPLSGAPGPDVHTVIERRDIAPNLIILKIQRPAGFEFRSGQSTKLKLAGISRRYSIASAPHENFLQFFIELVPGGKMSERLARLRAGDPVDVERPKGDFLLDGRFSNHLMVATVTGVSPFVSFLRDYLRVHNQAEGVRRFYLLHGASYQDEFGFRDELERIAEEHPDVLTYIPTVSRPGENRNSGWAGQHGRVGTLIDGVLERISASSESTCVYACGNPDMVDDVEQRYGSKGFTVKTERYS